MKRDFLDMTDFAPSEIDELLALALRLKRGEESLPDALHRKTLAMVFMDPSLRTRASFEVAMHKHGGHAVVLEPGRSSWAFETERGVVMDGTTVEHIAEAARVLGRYADAVAVRAFPKGNDWSKNGRTASSATLLATAGDPSSTWNRRGGIRARASPMR